MVRQLSVSRYEKAHRVAKAHLSPAEKTELYIQLAQAPRTGHHAFLLKSVKSAGLGEESRC